MLFERLKRDGETETRRERKCVCVCVCADSQLHGRSVLLFYFFVVIVKDSIAWYLVFWCGLFHCVAMCCNVLQ